VSVEGSRLVIASFNLEQLPRDRQQRVLLAACCLAVLGDFNRLGLDDREVRLAEVLDEVLSARELAEKLMEATDG